MLVQRPTPSVIDKRKKSTNVKDKGSGPSIKSARTSNVFEPTMRETDSSKYSTPSSEKSFSREARQKTSIMQEVLRERVIDSIIDDMPNMREMTK